MDSWGPSGAFDPFEKVYEVSHLLSLGNPTEQGTHISSSFFKLQFELCHAPRFQTTQR
jgi:hypothetical protein